MNESHGFIPDVIEPDNYLLGQAKVPTVTLEPDGQWVDNLPEFEHQKRNGLETSNCVGYGTLNCLEILYKRQYGEEINWSDRFVGILAGTTPSGNSPHKVAESIRKTGLVLDELLPFAENISEWDEYYSPNPMTTQYLKLGWQWLRTYEFKHEWVFRPWTRREGKVGALMTALRYSPIGISVYAWSWEMQGDEKIYMKPEGAGDNHWVVLYGYVEGKYWLKFDSYDDSKKKLAWDYDFGMAKRFYLERGKVKKRCGWLCRLLNNE